MCLNRKVSKWRILNNYHKFYLSLVLLWATIKSSCRDDLQIARNPDGVLTTHPHLAHFLFYFFHIFLSWFLFPTGYIYKSVESQWDSSPLFSINFNPTMPVSIYSIYIVYNMGFLSTLPRLPSILTPQCQSLYYILYILYYYI